MRIQRLSRYNLWTLERELDQIGFEKYDIVPHSPFVPPLDDLEFNDEDNDNVY